MISLTMDLSICVSTYDMTLILTFSLISLTALTGVVCLDQSEDTQDEHFGSGSLNSIQLKVGH